MNLIRRYTLHRFRSRHNPLSKAALILTLPALAMAALVVVSELRETKLISAADKAMLAELILLVEGKAKIVEVTGDYAVEYEMKRTTYEVMEK